MGVILDSDLLFVVGVILAGFAIPSAVSAYTDGRRPRTSAVTIVIAVGMISYAVLSHPGGYALRDIPEVFVRVAAKFI